MIVFSDKFFCDTNVMFKWITMQGRVKLEKAKIRRKIKDTLPLPA